MQLHGYVEHGSVFCDLTQRLLSEQGAFIWWLNRLGKCADQSGAFDLCLKGLLRGVVAWQPPDEMWETWAIKNSDPWKLLAASCGGSFHLFVYLCFRSQQSATWSERVKKKYRQWKKKWYKKWRNWMEHMQSWSVQELSIIRDFGLYLHIIVLILIIPCTSGEASVCFWGGPRTDW